MNSRSLLLLVMWVASPLAAQPLGTAFTYQGQLKDAGHPANELYDLQVCLFESAANPAPLACAPDFDDVPVERGLFTITLDFGAATFSGQHRFLELRVRAGTATGEYTTLSPRQLVRPAPEALRANVAGAAPWTGLTGVPAGFADDTDNNSGGTVTSVTGGAGLSGGTITGQGTLAIANGGVGLAQINTAQVQGRVIGTCPVGRYLQQVNADGTVSCGTDASGGTGTVTSVTAGTGLSGGTITGSGTLAIANGGVGLAQIDSTQVQARITGSCASGEYFRGVAANGSVICEPVPGVPRQTLVDDPTNTVGTFVSLAIPADGLPVISYRDTSTGALKVAKCANAACTGTATRTTVDNPAVNEVGFFTSLAIGADGFPVIGHRDFTAGALKVTKCANAACTTSSSTTVDDPANGNDVGAYTSLAIGSDGLPVIGYQDDTADSVKVAKCANAGCTSATITTLDDSASVLGRYIDIAVGNDGLPVISYHDATALSLKVAKCSNPACTAATFTTVDDPANSVVGLFTSVVIGSDGRPVVSYLDATADSLKVAKCANAACTGTAIITTVDDPGANQVGYHTSIAIGSDGLPVISHLDGTADSLKVAKCTNAACTGVSLVTTVDDPPNSVGAYTSIAVGSDGLPVIGYQDATAFAVKVAKCGTQSCQ